MSNDEKRFLFAGYRLLLSSVELVSLPEKKLSCDPGFFLEKVPVGDEPYFRPLVDAGYIRRGQIEFVVNYVIPQSAAEKPGLKPGDILIAINERKITQDTEPNQKKREEKVNTYIRQMCLDSYATYKFEVLRIANGTPERLNF